MLRSRFALAAFLLFASAARQARAAVRADRPRIWLSPDGLARFRERCTNNPRIGDLYGSVKEAVRGGRWESSNVWSAQARLQSAALVYIVEGKEAACLPLVKKLFRCIAADPGDIWRTASGLRAMAVAFDWCHDGLSTEERREFAGAVLTFAKAIYEYHPRRGGSRGAPLGPPTGSEAPRGPGANSLENAPVRPYHGAR